MNNKMNGKMPLLIIGFLFVCVFSVPTFNNIKESFMSSSYDKTTNKLINSAKSKYAGDVTDATNDEKEYTVKELIDEGYFDGSEINPLTNKKYNKDDKVLIITKNGITTYRFINGTTLANIIKDKNDILIDNDNYYFTGENPKNYVSFNEKIYRIISLNNDKVLIINDSLEKNISKDEINTYLKTSINDIYKEEYKKLIIDDLKVLDIYSFKNTIKNNKSFLITNNNIWISEDNEIKNYDLLVNSFINSDNAWLSPIITIDGNNVITKGDGSRLNPYTLY